MSLFATLRDLWSRLAAVGSIGTGYARRSLFDRISLSLRVFPRHGLRGSLFAWQLMPIAGGAPDDDDPDDDSSDDDSDSDDDGDDSADDDSEDDSDGDGADDEDDDEDSDEDDPPLSKKERDRLNQLEREAAERRQRDKEATRKRQEKEGKHAEVVQGLQKELDEANERGDAAEAALTTYKRNVVVSKVARRLRFQDPDDAAAFLPASLPDDASEADIEKALRDLVKTKSYLVKRGKRPGRPSGGGNDDDPSSAEEGIGSIDDPEKVREEARALRK